MHRAAGLAASSTVTLPPGPLSRVPAGGDWNTTVPATAAESMTAPSMPTL